MRKMKKTTILIILLILIMGTLFFFLLSARLQINQYKIQSEDAVYKYDRLFSQQNDMVSCFSNQITGVEICMSNCHDLSCYRGCHISNNDVLDKCWRKE